MNSIIKEIFDKYNDEELTSTEVSLFLYNNNIVQDKSGAETILDSININLSDDNFERICTICRIVYLQALSAYNQSKKELSFSEYINRCLQTQRTKIKFESLSNVSRESFWSLVSEIQTKL